MSRTAATRTCRAHCAACGRHFTSDGSVIAHRVGDYAKPNGHSEGRRCLDPGEDPRFVAIKGRCEMYRQSTAGTLYGLARDQERARAHFASLMPSDAAQHSPVADSIGEGSR